ncbi:MAG: hypothetical protein GEU68_05605 [Actinobacteria bacterium]|nr:hypothetical protein [Actinomycetota bacterium]
MRKLRFAVLGSVVALLMASMPSAVADTQLFVRSEPNGDISASAQSVASSDKDKDGDPDTLTQADNLHIFFSVFNLAEFAQTVRVTVFLDGPGDFQDLTLVDEEVELAGCDVTCTASRQGTFSLKVRRKDWPAGTYSLSVTGSGSETATAVTTFTVAYNK